MLCLNVLPCNHSQVVLFLPFGTTRYKSDCILQKSSSDILLVPNRHLQHFMLFGCFFFFFPDTCKWVKIYCFLVLCCRSHQPLVVIKIKNNYNEKFKRLTVTGTYVTVAARLDGAAHSCPNRSSPGQLCSKTLEVLLSEFLAYIFISLWSRLSYYLLSYHLFKESIRPI